MTKIVHIARPVAGVGIYINLLYKYIDHITFNNILLCNEKDQIIDIKSLTNKSIKTYHVNLKREINIINDYKCLIDIIKHLKKIKPNVIHCHSAKAGILGRIAGAYLGIPTLYTPHAYSYLSATTKKKQKKFKRIEQLFNLFPAKTLACSTSEYNRTINDLKFNAKKALLWNNAIENNFNLQAFEDKLPSNFICSIGRPSYQKNTQLLIHSFFELKKRIPNIHLVILGAGHFSPELEAVNYLIQKLNLNESITIIPWLERAKTLYILKLAKLYISTSRYEGLPYAVIEAIALSKACVVTNVDGHKDLIEDKVNGFLVNENPLEISKKIVEILLNNNLRESMENASKKIYEQKFNINKNISLLEKIYLQQL
ncbi:glycosyltransferase [Tenacibaculum jejuense]|uniref:Glycosyl transferase, group 4 family protein n=1 Tax=Tenacibaculum jejuense TaxID=584609 RepID=A0A238UES2_9FLAO|nr:glycosyltransferase [Tenacibaculum jejuense]SNR17703.1 Glycosyl transferase, group 4 family protein [Tenacibaculum jejuense]